MTFLLCPARPSPAATEIEVYPDPSRTTPVHRIPMYDEGNRLIRPDERPVRPFSQRTTCGKCHDYDTISGGWHFNGSDAKVPPGRPGQAWILADTASGTQIPVSPRGWAGTWRPEDVGLSAWQFVLTFGRHFPGGDIGEKYPRNGMDPASRWVLSGDLEINCLGCHNPARTQDQNLWAEHVSGRENFRWAGAAASGLAHVDGFVNKLPSNFDPLSDTHPDFPGWVPKVTYRTGLFNPKKEVFFDVVRKHPVERCYYCHTNHTPGKPEWQQSEDVHVARGFACADCHRNGLNHAITRNYEGELAVGSQDRTCRGCHLGDERAVTVSGLKGGHLVAPKPLHAGFPQVHFDKLSCTACHCGPYPQKRTQRVMTSRAHGLGYHALPYLPKGAPNIQEPVFVKQYDGKIAPHRMVFPAFWGRLKDGKVTPIHPAVAAEATGWLLKGKAGKEPRPPTVERITKAMKILAADTTKGEAVYVVAGKLYRLQGERLVGTDHEAARPYSWPLAHDVRPAVQSLGYGGAEGCDHCHASGSGFLFGEVSLAGPAKLGESETRPMHEFAELSGTYHKLFGLTFVFRPWLKIVGFAAAGVLAAVLALYGFLGLRVVLTRLGWRARKS